MHYHIYCNQKNISAHHQAAIAEFKKRLSAYCETTLHLSSHPAILKEIPITKQPLMRICSGPSTYSSEEFAQMINKIQLSGRSTVYIIIGFSDEDFYGSFANEINPYEVLPLSLSRSQFSSETQTLLFYEQLYRGYTILQGKTYHK